MIKCFIELKASLQPIILVIVIGMVLFSLGALVVLDGQLLIYVIGFLFLLVLFVSSVKSPIIVIVISLISSALSGAFVSLRVQELPFSFSGFLTFLIAAITFIVLLLRIPVGVILHQTRHFKFFILFLLFYGIRTITSPYITEGFRIWFLLIVPVLIGIFTTSYLSLRPKFTEIIEKLILLVLFIPVIVILINIFTGGIVVTATGFRTTQFLTIGPRPLSLFLLPVLAVYIANWRYSPGYGRKTGFLAGSILIVAIIVASLSRVASVISLIFLFPFRYFKRIINFSTIIIIVVGLILLFVWFAAPGVQSRFFPQGFDFNNLTGNLLTNIDTQGRINYWKLVWSRSLESPIIGNGAGSSKIFLQQMYPHIDHPHNEFLRIFNDGGLIGLILLSIAWLEKGIYHYKLWQKSGIMAKKFHFAALLSTVAIIISSLTDNSLVYAFVTMPVFIIYSLAINKQSEFEKGT